LRILHEFNTNPIIFAEDPLLDCEMKSEVKNGDVYLDKKYLFDEVVLNYEKRRPNYGAQIFSDIINYAGITMDSSIIEVGCGTGQATAPFLKTKCHVVAVELGENLAAFTREKFKDYSNLEVIHSSYEDYACDDHQFDMLFSATAFHWIADDLGYKKAYQMLKSGGTLALFWNRPSPVSEDDRTHQEIQAVYQVFLPEWSKRGKNSKKKLAYSSIEKIAQYGFRNIEKRVYHHTRTMTGSEYVELLNTYSDHVALVKSIQVPFYKAIREAIEQSGDKVMIHDTVELYLARK